MNFVVTVEGKRFEVEVGDLEARPIIAAVEGEQFEVWPENSAAVPRSAPTAPGTGAPGPGSGRVQPPRPVQMSQRTTEQGAVYLAGDTGFVFAPIPGVVESIAVHPGDYVAIGQELLILEAMKMKNVIRASRAGEIESILVSVGQHVRHHDRLVKYIC